MPGAHSLASYRKSWLQHDLVAGLVLSTLLVPQGMAYAELAGLPAITGRHGLESKLPRSSPDKIRYNVREFLNGYGTSNIPHAAFKSDQVLAIPASTAAPG